VSLKEILFLFALPFVCMLAASIKPLRRARVVTVLLLAAALFWILFWDGCVHIADRIGTSTSGAGSTLSESFDHTMNVAAVVAVVWAVLITLYGVFTEKEKRQNAVIVVPIVLVVAGAITYFSLWIIKRFSQMQ
jgi:peptidoglycan/LPS O-acetylase OafA/YrhL